MVDEKREICLEWRELITLAGVPTANIEEEIQKHVPVQLTQRNRLNNLQEAFNCWLGLSGRENRLRVPKPHWSRVLRDLVVAYDPALRSRADANHERSAAFHRRRRESAREDIVSDVTAKENGLSTSAPVSQPSNPRLHLPDSRDSTDFSVALIFDHAGSVFAAKYADELEWRGVRVHHVLWPNMALHATLKDSRSVIVVLTPELLAEPASADLAATLREVSGLLRIALIGEGIGRLPDSWHLFYPIDRHQFTPDLAFEELLRFVLGPLPPWLQLYCRPSRMRDVTGVAWWNEDILVADQHYDHIVRIGRRYDGTLLAGLDEPHHIHLDRRMLLVANSRADEIITGTFRGGALSDVTSFDPMAFGIGLKRPHSAFQGQGFAVVADTDNHRILVKPGHMLDAGNWQHLPVAVKFPCSVWLGAGGAWIADTFQHRVVLAGLSGNAPSVACIGAEGDVASFAYPVAVAHWGDKLFVSDEGHCRLQVMQHAGNLLDPNSSCWMLTSAFAHPYIGSPFGISFNRAGLAVVADRSRGCCWTIDLKAPQLFSESHEGPSKRMVNVSRV